VFSEFESKEMREDVVKAPLDVKEEGRGFHSGFLGSDDFVFEGYDGVGRGDAGEGTALVLVNKS
jgi:hypothetical protein